VYSILFPHNQIPFHTVDKLFERRVVDCELDMLRNYRYRELRVVAKSGATAQQFTNL
jgi:hypothetical protein